MGGRKRGGGPPSRRLGPRPPRPPPPPCLWRLLWRWRSLEGRTFPQLAFSLFLSLRRLFRHLPLLPSNIPSMPHCKIIFIRPDEILSTIAPHTQTNSTTLGPPQTSS